VPFSFKQFRYSLLHICNIETGKCDKPASRFFGPKLLRARKCRRIYAIIAYHSFTHFVQYCHVSDEREREGWSETCSQKLPHWFCCHPFGLFVSLSLSFKIFTDGSVLASLTGTHTHTLTHSHPHTHTQHTHIHIHPHTSSLILSFFSEARYSTTIYT